MGIQQRVALAIALLVIDLVAFFVPLSAILLAYVIVFYPKWARDFVKGLDPPAP